MPIHFQHPLQYALKIVSLYDVYICMVTALCLLLFIALLTHTVAQALQERNAREEQKALESLREFQAYAIKQYHPVFKTVRPLSEMSTKEIRRYFNVTDTYHKIGRW